MSTIASLYADLSTYYDQFCADIDYREQADFARRAFQCFGESGGNAYLDLACGTGAHLVWMADSGFTLAGLDNAPHMLERAAAKVPNAELILSDMACLEKREAYDLITCFLYSIHYNHPYPTLEQALACAWQALKPGGLLLFNAVDARGIKGNNRVVSEVSENGVRLRFASGWEHLADTDKMELHLTITCHDANGSREWQDCHTMNALTFPQLTATLKNLGFEATLLEHDYQVLKPWDGSSFNVIVAAFKPRT